MKIKEGGEVRSLFDGEEYTVARVGNEMMLLKSSDGEKQIMTGIESLNRLYSKKKEEANR